MFGLKIYHEAFRRYNMGYACALAWVLVVAVGLRRGWFSKPISGCSMTVEKKKTVKRVVGKAIVYFFLVLIAVIFLFPYGFMLNRG